MRNRFPGTCYRCGQAVEAGEGHFEKAHFGPIKWRTQHAECAIAYRGTKVAGSAERPVSKPAAEKINRRIAQRVG